MLTAPNAHTCCSFCGTSALHRLNPRKASPSQPHSLPFSVETSNEITAAGKDPQRSEPKARLKMSGETKVADVAAQLRQKIPVNRGTMMRFYEWYHKTYFKTGSFQPVVHLMIGAGVLGYMIEYPHIKHELEEQAKHANDV